MGATTHTNIEVEVGTPRLPAQLKEAEKHAPGYATVEASAAEASAAVKASPAEASAAVKASPAEASAAVEASPAEASAAVEATPAEATSAAELKTIVAKTFALLVIVHTAELDPVTLKKIQLTLIEYKIQINSINTHNCIVEVDMTSLAEQLIKIEINPSKALLSMLQEFVSSLANPHPGKMSTSVHFFPASEAQTKQNPVNSNEKVVSLTKTVLSSIIKAELKDIEGKLALTGSDKMKAATSTSLNTKHSQPQTGLRLLFNQTPSSNGKTPISPTNFSAPKSGGG